MAKHPAFHIYHGTDDFRRQAAIRAAVETYVSPDAAGFDVERLSAQGMSAAQLSAVLGTPPFFGECRVVVVEDAQDMSKEVVQVLLEELGLSLQSGGQGVALVLSYSGGRKAPVQLSRMAAVVQEFRKLNHRDAVGFVRTYAQSEHGLLVAPAVAELLVMSVGVGGSGELASEVDKLALVAEGGRITREDVEFATGDTAQQSPFLFNDRIAERNFIEAGRLLEKLVVQQGLDGGFLAIMLADHLAAIGVARSRLDAGENVATIARDLGGGAHREWVGRKYVDQAKHWTQELIDKALVALGEADLRIKRDGIDGKRSLELFLSQVSLNRG